MAEARRFRAALVPAELNCAEQVSVELLREAFEGSEPTYGMSARRGPPWWAAVERAAWPMGLAIEILPLWDEEFGDRQVELQVKTASCAAREAAERALKATLLSKKEMAAGLDQWCMYDDPLWELERAKPGGGFSFRQSFSRPAPEVQCLPCPE